MYSTLFFNYIHYIYMHHKNTFSSSSVLNCPELYNSAMQIWPDSSLICTHRPFNSAVSPVCSPLHTSPSRQGVLHYRFQIRLTVLWHYTTWKNSMSDIWSCIYCSTYHLFQVQRIHEMYSHFQTQLCSQHKTISSIAQQCCGK